MQTSKDAFPAEIWPVLEGADPVGVRPIVLRKLVSDIAGLPDSWSGRLEFDLGKRHCVRLSRNSSIEVWLICWELGQDTLLHDHGGSSGAFALVRGSLIEDHADVDARDIRTREHRTGDAVAFGPRYLHNLVNVSGEPAVSLHAYSPPLRSMNFYGWSSSGPRHLREIPCDSPEPDLTGIQWPEVSAP
ncbi:cysteine dioxygenase [Amycolatopsis japonica]